MSPMSRDSLTQWTAAATHALQTEFDITIPEVDVHLLLDVARDAAHAVDRPAAPITTFLLGYAAALAGADAVGQGAHTLNRLAAEWDLGLHQS